MRKRSKIELFLIFYFSIWFGTNLPVNILKFVYLSINLLDNIQFAEHLS